MANAEKVMNIGEMYYINVAFPTEAQPNPTPVWAHVDTGFSTVGTDYGANSEDGHWVGSKDGFTEILSYTITFSLSQIVHTGEAVNDFINRLEYFLGVGLQAQTDFVVAKPYMTGDPEDAPARRYRVNVEFGSNDNEGGTALSRDITLNSMGDSVEGAFDAVAEPMAFTALTWNWGSDNRPIPNSAP